MPLFEITELVRYRLNARSASHAEEVYLDSDNPDEFFYTVDQRGVREIHEDGSPCEPACDPQEPEDG